jgi:hypothetical protein
MTEFPCVRPDTSDMPAVQGFRRSSYPYVLSRGTAGDVISYRVRVIVPTTNLATLHV